MTASCHDALGMSWNDLVKHLPLVVPDELRRRGLNFPSMPESILRFSELAMDPDVTLAELAAPLERDPGHAVDLLKFVNSAASGLQTEVHSIRQALALLGPSRSRTLILSSVLQQRMGNKVDPEPFRRYQREAVERATCAAQVAERLDGCREDAYLAGLLQDLLLPSLSTHFPHLYQDSLHNGKSLAEREVAEFGWTHADLAATLLRDWNFPELLVCCVALHHRFELLFLEPGLRCRQVLASVVAGSIPTESDPRPLGHVSPTALQRFLPDVSLLEIAVAVDETMQVERQSWPGRMGLCQRLGDQIQQHLDQRRLASIAERLRLGHYTLDRELGTGGMGTVFLAHHDRLRRPTAIKMLNNERCTPQLMEDFESEVQLMSMLRSPHIVHVYDYGITREGVLYYVMEYVPGETLRDFVIRRGPLSQTTTLHVLEQMCLALGEAHAAHILHGDISLRNIMISPQADDRPFVKLLDFGLASLLGDADQPDYCRGTPVFIAPEVLLNPGQRNVSAEIYAVGVAAYFMLTGKLPFCSDTIEEAVEQTLHSRPPRMSESRPRGVSRELESLVMECLAKSPEERPQSATELLSRLRRCELGSAVELDELLSLPVILEEEELDLWGETVIKPASGSKESAQTRAVPKILCQSENASNPVS